MPGGKEKRLEEKIRELILDNGGEIVGFSDIRGYEVAGYEALDTGIAYGVRLSEAIVSQIDRGPTHEYFHHYRTVNRLIDDIGLKVAVLLQRSGYRALPVAASQSINSKAAGAYEGLFSHRMAATLGGLGWIGKNNSLIHPVFGPGLRLGTVLTNAPLKVAQPITASQCGDCSLCVDACPALALSGMDWEAGIPREMILDARACSEHMKHHYQHIGRGAVCGICLAACPYGRT
ncbi:MAG: 4Fe-4S ferredoxin [delta proteobacterium ML8_F1]|nr:MAG: 4Fe-4S ferredoxin [delta proteobacterium ML8_F1]